MAERFAAQLLSGRPASDPLDVVRRLLAVQGQDPRGVRLAIRARSAGLTVADVDRALTQDRSLLITWLNRGTLHLVTSEDYWWLHPLTTPPLATACARRLAQEGVPPGDADKAVRVIDEALAADGPLTRRQLGERVAAAGVRTKGQALVHLLFLASLHGIAIRGPMMGTAAEVSGAARANTAAEVSGAARANTAAEVSGAAPANTAARTEQGYVRVRDWLGERPHEFDRDRALAELARRYLAGHGPATDRDLAGWAGLPLRDARRGLSQIGAELADRPDGLASLAGVSRPAAGGPPPRLLGSYDPVLHGWSSREPVTGRHADIVTTNGLFRPFALVGGKAVALWGLAAGRVTLRQLEEISDADHAALLADADDVLRFLGLAGCRSRALRSANS